MVDSARSLFKLIYKVGMIIATLVLGGGAVLAYVSATPGNGLLLVAGILALLTLIAGLSINKLDWQDQQAETYRQIGEEIRDRIRVAARYSHAEPEVHRVDATMVEEAKRGRLDRRHLHGDRPRPRRPRPGAPGGVPQGRPGDDRQLTGGGPAPNLD